MNACHGGVIWALLFTVAAIAQSGAGIVKGTVQDASKAIVPNAKAKLKNRETNISRETAGSGDGLYYFGGIEPGRYQLTVTVEGFKKWMGELVVEVGQTVVVDPTMEVGSLASTVEVT